MQGLLNSERGNHHIHFVYFSHMKCETLDTNFFGKNFRDYVFASDIPSIERHFQEGKSINSNINFPFTINFSH